MLLFISLVLAVIPLLGIVVLAFSSSLTTVDGLFTSLILLGISALFGSRALFELRRRKLWAAATVGRVAQSSFAAASGLIQRGKVESVEFFEAHVGQPNKSIVTLSNAANPAQMMVFEGDMRNALPTGQKVEITLRKMSGYNVLVEVSYS
jgi:hypothetical protein